MIAALTVRKLKPGTYDEWRKAWWSDDVTPPDAEIYILRNFDDPNEIIAFGLVEGKREEIEASFDKEQERARQEQMAPFVESIGADGIYEVVERIGTKAEART